MPAWWTPADFVRIAYSLKLKEEGTDSSYAAVIVDEVQDISEIALRLLHSLVGNREDGLLLVGDSTQRIFTRGYSLRALGIDISGRGLVLRKNYRNTKQIADRTVTCSSETRPLADQSRTCARHNDDSKDMAR
jgi:ATP-dependent exoDNAse (exonuclease V) beta subunit